MAQCIQIGKVAEQTGLSIDTIRFYQKIGLVKQPVRSAGGFRLFTENEINQLLFIQRAQDLGFSLTEIKQLSILHQEPEHACAQVRELIKDKLRDVRLKLGQLRQLEADLSQALRKCDRSLRSDQGHSHTECCPVLDSLERNDARNDARSGPRRRRRR